MRATVLAVVALAACSEPAERAEFEAAGLTLRLPRGWTVERDVPAPEGAVALRGPPHPTFRPSMVIQGLPVGSLPASIDEAWCAEQGVAFAAIKPVTVLGTSVVTLGDARGCKMVVENASAHQVATQHALGNRERVVSVVCNRTSDGHPAADAACDQLVRAIWSTR